MSAIEHSFTGRRAAGSADGRARLSFASQAEIDEFVSTLERFERGEVTPDAWRAFRLVRGTYAQRQAGDFQMLRVKIPQGVLDGAQLEALADVAERWSRGFLHVTTRQNVQFHFLKLHDVEPALRRLAEAGLTTREACGNSVRNVTACPYAGVSAEEVFDVTPYAEALTRHLLRHPLSSTLPRKFKMAFEGCAQDHALAAINDIGWQARLRFEAGALRHGFRVTVGGGTSILCRSGQVLFDFLPASEMLALAEAVLRVYQRRGDYAHRQRNRLKFLIRDLGWEAWRGAFQEEFDAVRREGVPPLPFDPDAPPVEEPPVRPRPAPPSVQEAARQAAGAAVRGPGITPRPPAALPVAGAAFERWAAANVRPQKQAGQAAVVVTLPLGDVTAAQLRLLAGLAAAYGDGTVRTTHEQDLLLRWVRSGDVRAVHAVLAAAGLAEPGGVANVTSCPGAEACRLAVTQSRGVALALHDRLIRDGAAAAGLAIKVSGCPNGCGHHHVGGIGLQGSVRRLGSRVVPQYFVFVGGGVGADGARFGSLAAKIPARRVADAVDRILSLYAKERGEGEAVTRFLQRVDPARVKAVLSDLEAITLDDATPEDFVDLGEEAEFQLAAMEGECSA
jgi:sulfite reductase (NADPH) hemoprotein beta-component